MHAATSTRLKSWVARIAAGAMVASALTLGAVTPASAEDPVVDPGIAIEVAPESEVVEQNQTGFSTEEDGEGEGDGESDAPGALSGVVTAPDGTPLVDIRVVAHLVEAEHSWYEYDSTTTGADGGYTLSLAPGDYLLQFLPDAESDWAGEWWDSVGTAASATPVTVTADATTEGIDPVLEPKGTIAGTVRDQLDAAAPDVEVRAFAPDGLGNAGAQVATATTDADGDYLLSVPAGEYLVEFATENAAPELVGEWWDDQPYVEVADPVTVLPGEQTDGIDPVLELRGSVSGAVVDDLGNPVSQVSVSLFAFDEWQSDWTQTHWASTEADGTYTVADVAAGHYKVRFSTWSAQPSAVSEWWGDVYSEQAAPWIVVAPGEHVTQISPELERGAVVSGRVVDDAGQPLADVSVGMNRVGEGYAGWWPDSGWTNEDGTFEIRGLAAGDYQVSFRGGSSSLSVVPEWWDDAADPADATLLTLTRGETRAGIDAELQSAASLSGVVTTEDGTPVGSAEVIVYRVFGDEDEYWDFDQSAYTDENGAWAVRNLRPGEYRVKTATASAEPWVVGAWWHEGESIILDAGDHRDDIAIELAPAGALSGTVTGPGGQPATDMQVIAHPAGDDESAESNSSWVDSEGQYTLRGLAAGDYLVEFRPSRWATHNVAGGWWQDAQRRTDATPVTVTVGEATGGISPSLPRGAQVLGIVTDESGTGVADVDVQAYRYVAEDDDWVYAGWATTGPDGAYRVHSLTGGEYRIEFTTWGVASAVVGQWWDGAADLDSATSLSLVTGQTVSGISPVLSAGASLSGTVSAGGAPLASSEVTLYRYGDGDWDSHDWAWTDDDGAYEFTRLPAGSYRVQFRGSDDALGQWWEGAAGLYEATTIELDAAETRTGIDADLAQAGVISGRVTDNTGAAVDSAYIDVYRYDESIGDWEYARSAYTDEDGYYVIGGLEPGDFRLRFGPGGDNANVLAAWWENADGLDTATTIPVVAGVPVTGIDPQLAVGGSIVGTVRSDDGEPVEGAYVAAYRYIAEEGWWDWAGSSRTDASGEFAVRGLESDDYRVRIDTRDAVQNVAGEWWEDADARETATSLTVTAGDAPVEIAPRLAAGASISGTVSFPDGVVPSTGDSYAYLFQATDDGDYQEVADTWIESDGTYTIRGLAAGSYKLQFQSWDRDVLDEWWDDAADFASATAIDLDAGQARTDVDAQLAPGGSLVGTVRTDADAPVGGARIDVYRYDSAAEWWDRTARAWSDENGEFAVRGLTSGEYRVRISTYDADQNVAGEWWQDAETVEQATTVTVVAGGAPTVIAPRLAPGASLSGRVTTAPDAPLADVTVTAYRSDGTDDWVWAASTDTAEDGTYALQRLSAGNYRLEYSTWNSDVIGQWWGGAYDRYDATSIEVEAGQIRDDLDVQLARGASIEGSVTDAAGQAFGDAYATAWRQDASGGWDYITSATADDAGDYVLSGLPAGDYTLMFSASAPEGVYTQWWEKQRARTDADLVEVAAGAELTGYDATLADDDHSVLEDFTASISGRVTDANGVGLAGVLVEIDSGEGGGDIRTGADGTYHFDRVAAGEYRVRFDGGPEYAVAWWEGATSREQSKTVPLTRGGSATNIDAVLTRIDEFVAGGATIDNGTPRVGDLLTAGASGWSSGTAFTYQWRADGVDIPGATARELRVGPALVGRVITVQVTGSKPGHDPQAQVSTVTAPVAAGTLTASTPTIAGAAKLGTKLAASAGEWTTGTDLAYQWNADGAAIAGATASEFTPTTAQVGKTLTVTVTGALAGYATASRTSAATAAVAAGTLAAPTPTITGTAKSGSKLTATPGTWTSGAKLTYQWKAGGVNIAKATASTFTPAAAQVGKTITVTVTGALTGYTTASKTSAPTAKVAALALKSATPTVSGTAAVGSKLTAKPGSWTAATKLVYQWLADGKAIGKATKSTFTLTKSQAGKKITVRVTGSKAGHVTVAKTSKATAKVATTATPKITGSAKVGKKLTAKPGTWTKGTKFSYQWFAGGKAIKGATTSTFTLKAAQRGKAITVKVTGKKSGFATVSKTSKATKKVG